MFKNLMKAAIAVAVTPITVVADIVTLPASAERGDGPFDKTASTLKLASDSFKRAVK